MKPILKSSVVAVSAPPQAVNIAIEATSIAATRSKVMIFFILIPSCFLSKNYLCKKIYIQIIFETQENLQT